MTNVININPLESLTLAELQVRIQKCTTHEELDPLARENERRCDIFLDERLKELEE